MLDALAGKKGVKGRGEGREAYSLRSIDVSKVDLCEDGDEMTTTNLFESLADSSQ